MLKIDRADMKLLRLQPQLMIESGMTERSDLQELIFQNATEFFAEECGEDLFLIDTEVNPSIHVLDRVDILAVDKKGKVVVIELKRGNDKRQLLQALSYAAMVSELTWDEITKMIKRNDRVERLEEFMPDDILQDKSTLNSAQRIIMIAESYDYEVLQTAKWLTDHHGLNITCYQVALATDHTNEAQYLSAVQLFPAKSLADQARTRGALRSQQENEQVSLEARLAACKSFTVKGLFEALLTRKPRRNGKGDAIVFPPGGKMRIQLRVRDAYARVTQLGRFDGDEARWGALSDPNLAKPAGKLRFRLYSDSDVQVFQNFLDKELSNILWSGASSGDDEADDEENV